MTCSRAEKLFSACWEDELSLSERESLEAHFQSCASCRQAYDGMARTLEAVAALPRVEAAPGFVESVWARVRESEAREAETAGSWRLSWSWSPALWKPALAAAAALTVIVGTVSYVGQRPADFRLAQRAKTESPAPALRIPASVPREGQPLASSTPSSSPTGPVAPSRDEAAGSRASRAPAPVRLAARPVSGMESAAEAKAGAGIPMAAFARRADGLAAVPDSLFDHDYDVEFALDPVNLRRAPGGKSLRPARPMPSSEYGRRASITF